MAKNVAILDYLPEVVSVIKDFKVIASLDNPELSDLWTGIEQAFYDQYVSDATSNGTKRYESILRLVPKATETLDERKYKILTKYNEQLPYTYRAMLQRLDTLCGAEGYTVDVDLLGYTVTVRVELSVRNNYSAIEELLDHIIPMNMEIDLSLRYNQHSTLAKFTGAQLSAYTHEQLRNEVIS